MEKGGEQITIEQAFQLAFGHHQAGRLAEAEGLYRQILEAQPNHFNAVHLLGALAFQTGRLEEAGELLRKAIALHGAAAGPYYQLALARNERFAEAWNNLGSAYRDLAEIDKAIAAFRRAIERNPAFA